MQKIVGNKLQVEAKPQRNSITRYVSQRERKKEQSEKEIIKTRMRTEKSVCIVVLRSQAMEKMWLHCSLGLQEGREEEERWKAVVPTQIKMPTVGILVLDTQKVL
jgi:hypothetical protein